MVPKKLNTESNLVYFLNDINENDYGMYIAAGYEFFIKLQKKFLDFVIEHGKDKPYLKFYFENMNNKIPIYEANNNQILLIYNICGTSGYKGFADLLDNFTKRNIYKENGTIDYLNYNDLKFDFQAIEEELAKLILTGKCLFEDEDHLNFVNYWGEGFNGGKSDFLQRFEEQHETIELTDDEKMKINDYIKDNFFKENELKTIYGYIQLLIFYLTNNNFNEGDKIIDIINKLPDNIRNKDENINAIFNTNGIGLKANKIISLFLFFEHLCFELFSANLKDEYKEDIKEDTKNKISDKLVNNKDVNDVNYEKMVKQLAASVRRFISRYLYKINNPDEFSPKSKLNIQLKRIDIWDKDTRTNESIESIIDLIKEFDLTVGQSLRFYELIKEDDEKEINMFSEEDIKRPIKEKHDGEGEIIVNKPIKKRKKFMA